MKKWSVHSMQDLTAGKLLPPTYQAKTLSALGSGRTRARGKGRRDVLEMDVCFPWFQK